MSRCIHPCLSLSRSLMSVSLYPLFACSCLSLSLLCYYTYTATTGPYSFPISCVDPLAAIARPRKREGTRAARMALNCARITTYVDTRIVMWREDVEKVCGERMQGTLCVDRCVVFVSQFHKVSVGINCITSYRESGQFQPPRLSSPLLSFSSLSPPIHPSTRSTQ